MSEETPAEREERLQRAEERLGKQHNRLMEQPPSGGGGGGGGFKGFFSNLGEHKVMLIGAIVGIAFVIYVIYKGRVNPTTTANQQGSLGNAGYQDSGVAYALTQLGQQLNNLQAQMGAQPPANNPPTPNPTPNPVGPLIPSGTYRGPSYSNLPPGTTYMYNNVLYKLFTGGGGRLYGTNPQGQSILLYGPPSSYPLLNPQAAHSPIQSFLPLIPLADHGFDVSNLSVAARPGLATSPHPGLSLQVRG